MGNKKNSAINKIIAREKLKVSQIDPEVNINGISTNDMTQKEIEEYIKILNSILDKRWVETL